MCNGGCINPLTDSNFCGASGYCSGASAGAACSGLQTCVAGTCTPPPCTWTQLLGHSLTSAPAGSISRNGGAAATVAGRTAWLQTSDWNVLLIPHGLAAGDDIFATEVDTYLPTVTTYQRMANLAPFTTSATAPGPQGTCQFLGGIWGGPVARSGSGSTVEWWSAACPNTLLSTAPMASPTGAWHRLRIEGIRSTCRYRLLLDGSLLSSKTGACDPNGSYLMLFGSSPSWNSAQVAWSNLAVYKGSEASCIP